MIETLRGWLQGLPERIITPELVRSVYDVELEIREVDGKPFVIPV